MAEESSSSESARGGRSPDLAREAHEDLAAGAAAYLERSGYTIKGFGEGPEEIDRQADCLADWARSKKALLSNNYLEGLLKYAGASAEHEVFYRGRDNCVVKRTYSGTFGLSPLATGEQCAATPLFYLKRLQLMNRVFSSDLRLEGIFFGKSLLVGARDPRPSIVISQRWIRAADLNEPHPSLEEIGEFMRSLGFAVLEDSYFGWRREDGIITLDARSDNFIKSSEGIIPIDLVIAFHERL